MEPKTSEATLQSLIESRGWRYENRDNEIYACKVVDEARMVGIILGKSLHVQ